MRFKKLDDKKWDALAAEIKMMLHAHRDCLRTQWRAATHLSAYVVSPDAQSIETTPFGRVYNPRLIRYSCADGYYGEAFGVARALHVLGYGTYMQANNTPAEHTNLKWWFDKLCDEVLAEENFGGTGECDWCLNRYGKDDAGRTKR